ncbi:MAG: hypothetical protein OHK0024_28350 [Thalassobaculales bacterium]
MPDHALLIEVTLLTGRFHGAGGWPPAPFRLFQALVAGAYGGRWAGEEPAAKEQALGWLERLPPPLIAAPPRRRGRDLQLFVPNNDMDAVDGDMRRMAKIRTAKRQRPALIEGDAPIAYLWPFTEGLEQARQVVALADRLHCFGWGIDAAFARADIVAAGEAEALLAARGAALHRPSPGLSGEAELACPLPGSLDSLKARHRAGMEQFRAAGHGRNRVLEVHRAPKAESIAVAYDAAPRRLLFDLVPQEGGRRPYAWRLTGAVSLAERLRDAAAARLARALPAEAARIERFLVGRGAASAEKEGRVRIIPLPSIGSAFTDASIRRVLVEIPHACPLPQADLAWAFSGLNLDADPQTGEVLGRGLPVLAPAGDPSMLRHYAIASPAAPASPTRAWRTVTPAALPVARAGGRLTGRQRQDGEAQAIAAVRAALRHAGIATPAESIRVQREPFHGRGRRAEDFARPDRFPAERLWHVEIGFALPVAGPLLIGDGRYLGLGLLAPAAVRGERRDALLLALAPDCRPPVGERETVLRAARRALMSLAADAGGRIPPLFSGHDGDAGPARSGTHRHVYIFAQDSDGDGAIDRIGVVAPWRVDRNCPREQGDSRRFEAVVTALAVLRAGRAGLLRLAPAEPPAAGDAAFARARRWIACTPYQPTRRPAPGADPAAAIAADLRTECRRRGLPVPEVSVVDGAGAAPGTLRLAFPTAIAGPLMLGRDAHRGGGMFVAEQ